MKTITLQPPKSPLHKEGEGGLHYQPSRMIIDPGSTGGGDEVEYYPVTDVQGTVYKLLDASGVEVADYTYSPFGERLTNSAPTIYMPLGFGGTYSDDDIGLLYAKSRYYDPHTTRFTTKDSYRGSKGSIISQNRYIYCHQNPILYADPAGYAPVEGDHADPCTTTDQDIHYEPDSSDLLPPEDLPCSANPEKVIGSDGETYYIPDGFTPNLDDSGNPTGGFLITIGNTQIEVFIKMNGQGELFVDKFAGVPGEAHSFQMATGLNNALREAPCLGKYIAKDIKFFEKTMDKFYVDNWSDFTKSYGDHRHGKQYTDFFFSAGIGFAVAMVLKPNMQNENDEGQSMWNSLETAGIDPFLFAMTHGFWNAFHNHSIGNGMYKLDYSFQGGGTNTPVGAKAGIVEITAGTMAMHYILANGFRDTSLTDYANSSNWSGLKSALEISAGIVGLFLGGLPGATLGVASIIAQAIQLMYKKDSTGTNWINNAGVTGDMMTIMRNNGLKKDSIFNNYDETSLFMASGLMNHFLSIQLHKYLFDEESLCMGDVIWAMGEYFDQSTHSEIEWQNKVCMFEAMYNLMINEEESPYGEWYKNWIGLRHVDYADDDGDGIPNWRDPDYVYKKDDDEEP